MKSIIAFPAALPADCVVQRGLNFFIKPRMVGPTFESSPTLEFIGFAGVDAHPCVAIRNERRAPRFDPQGAV